MIVEVEAAIRDGLVDVFMSHCFSVRTAGDGVAGLKEVGQWQPDLVLLDLMLPGMSGFEVCERLRCSDPDLPVIMLTARGNDDDIVQG
ncbi:MAG: response regulator, partial [Halobacteriales archaeon]|nr:response regulator [Halobacteriales archaeon]